MQPYFVSDGLLPIQLIDPVSPPSIDDVVLYDSSLIFPQYLPSGSCSFAPVDLRQSFIRDARGLIGLSPCHPETVNRFPVSSDQSKCRVQRLIGECIPRPTPQRQQTVTPRGRLVALCRPTSSSRFFRTLPFDPRYPLSSVHDVTKSSLSHPVNACRMMAPSNSILPMQPAQCSRAHSAPSQMLCPTNMTVSRFSTASPGQNRKTAPLTSGVGKTSSKTTLRPPMLPPTLHPPAQSAPARTLSPNLTPDPGHQPLKIAETTAFHKSPQIRQTPPKVAPKIPSLRLPKIPETQPKHTVSSPPVTSPLSTASSRRMPMEHGLPSSTSLGAGKYAAGFDVPAVVSGSGFSYKSVFPPPAAQRRMGRRRSVEKK